MPLRLRSVLVALGAAAALGLCSPAVYAQPSLAEAQQRHQRAVGLSHETPPNYEAAIAEYLEAYRLLAGHPRQYIELRNIAECYQNLGQYDRALEFFQRYLTEGGPTADDRARYEGAISALESTLGTLELTVNVPSAEVWIDERRAGTAPGRLRVAGGRHLVELRAAGFLPSRQESTLVSHQTLALAFRLQPLPHGLSPALFWTAAGATLASAAVGAVFGALALSARGSVDDRLNASVDDPSHFDVSENDRAHIRALSLNADIFYAVAGALGVTTVVLVFLTDFHGRERSPTALRIAPVMGPLAQGLALSGSF